jgi:hypothetical protein
MSCCYLGLSKKSMIVDELYRMNDMSRSPQEYLTSFVFFFFFVNKYVTFCLVGPPKKYILNFKHVQKNMLLLSASCTRTVPGVIRMICCPFRIF